MATAAKPFRVKYAPPGMTWAEVKKEGELVAKAPAEQEGAP